MQRRLVATRSHDVRQSTGHVSAVQRSHKVALLCRILSFSLHSWPVRCDWPAKSLYLTYIHNTEGFPLVVLQVLAASPSHAIMVFLPIVTAERKNMPWQMCKAPCNALCWLLFVSCACPRLCWQQWRHGWNNAKEEMERNRRQCPSLLDAYCMLAVTAKRKILSKRRFLLTGVM